MNWLTLITKMPQILILLKEAKEAFNIVAEKVTDPEVLKEITDVRIAIDKIIK